MFVTSNKHRNYSPPKTNLAKILKQNKIDITKKPQQQPNYMIPSIAPKPLIDEPANELPKYSVNHPNVTFADLNFLNIEDSKQSFPISRIETPKLGFSIKHPTPKLIRNQSNILKHPPQPKSLDQPKITFDDMVLPSSKELSDTSTMIYPDGHMSPLYKTRSANLIVV